MSQARGDMEIKIGDKTWTVHPDYDLITEIEDEMGGILPFLRSVDELEPKIRLTSIGLWALLRKYDEDLKELNKVMEFVVESGLLECAAQLYRVLVPVIAGYNKADENPPETAAEKTPEGNDSTQSPGTSTSDLQLES
tara:strand:+ start:4435 stop:4848 length:414 start_codon:yes stop_codon:yes gene_type:complete